MTDRTAELEAENARLKEEVERLKDDTLLGQWYRLKDDELTTYKDTLRKCVEAIGFAYRHFNYTSGVSAESASKRLEEALSLPLAKKMSHA